MSDNEIRHILAGRKRRERRAMKRTIVLRTIGDIAAWAGLLFICFMLSVIGG